MKYVWFALCLIVKCHATSLQTEYESHCRNWSDIYEHLPHLHKLAKECPTVVELGLRSMNSSWGLLYGLSENPSPHRKYLGVDVSSPPHNILSLARQLAEEKGIEFTFLQQDDRKIQFPETELLFIDTYHTYCHLTYELETFSPKVKKYIAMHDTSAPWGDMDEGGNGPGYPEWIDQTKRGLWPAVEDFLARHPEWELMERHYNNHGFTILKRVIPSP